MINLLGTGYGILLHSCGVSDTGNGIVFAGVGGAGKTTTARLWNDQAGVRVLNDDRYHSSKNGWAISGLWHTLAWSWRDGVGGRRPFEADFYS